MINMKCTAKTRFLFIVSNVELRKLVQITEIEAKIIVMSQKCYGHLLQMKTILCVVLPFLSGGFGAACTSAPETNALMVNQQKDINAITAVSKARAKAFNESDAAGIAQHFTETGLLMAPGKKATSGRAAVAAYYQSIFDTYEPILDSYYEAVEVSGDLGYGRGFAKVTLIEKTTGDTLVSTSKYLNIMARQADGSWLTTHDIWNGNEPIAE